MKKIAIYIGVLLTSGCGSLLNSKFESPPVTYPEHWQQQTEEVRHAAIFDWREFADPQLDQWLQQVTAANSDVALAVLRLYRAQLESEQTGLNRYPSLSTSASTDISRNKSLSGTSELTKTESAKATLAVSYEVDLWGKLARQRDVAGWMQQVSEEDLRAARLMLTRRAAENYWRIALINQKITVSEQSLTYIRETLRLTQSRHRAGSIAGLDVINAQQSVLNQENSLQALRQQYQSLLNEQSVLLNAPPGKILTNPQHLPDSPLPVISPDVPVSVLSRRPDIRSAELNLRAALARVDIKRAEYYPSFSLTGSLGASSTRLSEFLSNPLAIINAVLDLPLTDWQQRELEISLAHNSYDQQVVQFRQSLYKAMASVDDALSQRQLLIAQETRLRELLYLAQKSERLNEMRYRHGSVAITDWLAAQDTRRRAQLMLDENRYDQLSNLMVLWLETGGAV